MVRCEELSLGTAWPYSWWGFYSGWVFRRRQLPNIFYLCLMIKQLGTVSRQLEWLQYVHKSLDMAYLISFLMEIQHYLLYLYIYNSFVRDHSKSISPYKWQFLIPLSPYITLCHFALKPSPREVGFVIYMAA